MNQKLAQPETPVKKTACYGGPRAIGIDSTDLFAGELQ
jgi:hypothetical protein